MSLQRVPQCERRGEYAEGQVGEGKGNDEGVPRVRPQLGGGEDDGDDGDVEEGSEDHDGQVHAQEDSVQVGGDVHLLLDLTHVLQKKVRRA